MHPHNVLAATALAATITTAALAAATHFASDEAVQLEAPAPAMLVTPVQVDLGTAPAGSQVDGHFLIANVGGQPARIDCVKPACGCTEISDLSESQIEPGAAIRVEFALKVPSKPGDHVKKVQLLLEDQSPLDVKLNITAVDETPEDDRDATTPVWDILPGSIDFGDVEPGETLRGDIHIANGSDEPITINTIKGNCGCTTIPETALPMTIKPWTVETVAVQMRASKKADVSSSKKVTIVDADDNTRTMQLSLKTKDTPSE